MKYSDAFITSLNDQRSVWLKGEKINVTEHPAFQGTLQTIHQLFAMLDEPAIQDQVGYQSVAGKYVHLSFFVPRKIEDLHRRRQAFERWSTATDGMMSRLSDYARSRLTGWYAARSSLSQYDSQFADKITRYYEEARDENRFISVVQRDVQINRGQQTHLDGESELLRITRKTEDGVYVSGAKMIATAAPYSNDFLIFPLMKCTDEQKAVANLMIVSANSPGLHIVCRESFSSPIEQKENHPLSSKYDEMDALLIFDDVFIPWEHVLMHENPAGVWAIKNNRHSNTLAYHQAIIRLKAKLEFLTGLACKLAESINAHQYLHVQEKLGELIGQVETIQAHILASESAGEYTNEGVFLPEFRFIETARNLGTSFYPRAIEILQLIAAGGLIQVPSSMKDFESEISPLLSIYFRGANMEAQERVKLFKLAWDVIGSPFASRHELYERFYAGDPIRNKAALYQSYDKKRITAQIDKYLK